MSTRTVLLAAGGTGGHLFPAASLGQELQRRGYAVELATDMRAEKYGGDFPARAIHRIPSATLTSRSPFAVAATFARLGFGYAGALRLLLKVKPSAVIGFGGYPTLPPIIAASTLRIPTAIHEQNAVMGRANRLLARFVDRIGALLHADEAARPRSAGQGAAHRHSGARAVLKFRDVPYAAPDASSRLLLLVFGGSQGARFFSEALPPALRACSAGMRGRLTIVQQAREEDLAELRDAYRAAGDRRASAPFFRDLPERIANAQLVIARAGASTVAELTAIGRPWLLLVPLPHALDNDQLENATRLQEVGGGWCVRQSELSAERLADLLQDPAVLAGASGGRREKGAWDGHGRCRQAARRSRRRAGEVQGVAFVMHMPDPQKTGLVHIVGIGGIGMSAIAEVMHTRGYTVQGSDQKDSANLARLRARDIRCLIGHDPANLDGASTLVISSAVKAGNPELEAAKERGIPIIRRAEMLAELMRPCATVSVTGTHGKTTTTSMIADLLKAAGSIRR